MENNAGLTNGKKAWAIFKWSVRKNLPFSIAYWILLFLTFPMVEIFCMIICNSNKTGFKEYITGMKEASYYLPSTVFAGVAILFSIIMAIIAFSYMHNKRSVDLFGSYPVSRRTLFFMRYLAVLTVCIVPAIVFGIIGGIIGFSDVAIINTAKAIGTLIVAIVGNVSFIAFISLCCGTVADVLISYVVISTIYPICVAIGYLFPASVIPGLTRGGMPYTVFTFLTPEAAFYMNYFGSGKVIGIVWWIALSAALMAGCFSLCRKRKAESAQNAFAFNAVEIVIKFFACFASGFGIGYMCSFFGETSMKSQYIWFVVGAVIAIMTANILLHLVFHRGLSGYRLSLVECGVVFVAIMAFLLIVTTGGFGYGSRIPDRNDIKEVSIKSGYNQSFTVGGKDLLETFTDDNEVIDETYKIHQVVISGITKHHGVFPINSTYYDCYDYETDLDNIKITYKLKNGKMMTRTYNITDTYTNSNTIKESLEAIKKTDYYSIANNPFTILPERYIESMNIDQRTVVSSISDYEDDIDYEIAEGTVEQNIDYLDIYDNKTKMNKLITALKKDVNKNGIYVPKEEQTCFSIAIYYRKSSSNYYYDDTVSVLLYIPETYTNTVNLLKEYDYYNLGYCYIKDYDYYLDEENPKLYQSNQTVYFEVPDNWDKNIDLQCMVYDEDLYSLCYIDSKITKCTKVSENVWSYTLPDTKKYSKEYGGNENAYKTKYIMFYQHGNEKINLTGLIEFSDDANGKMLTLGKQKITDYREFQNSMYEYDWVKFNN